MKLKSIAFALVALSSFNAFALTCGDVLKENDDLIGAQKLLLAISGANRDHVYDHLVDEIAQIEKGKRAIDKIIYYKNLKPKLIALCVDENRDFMRAITSKTVK